MISNVQTGQAAYFGLMCLTMMGLTTLKRADEESLDELVKMVGYQVTATEKKARVARAAPDYDPNRTIGEVVETAPRPSGDESVSGQSDESVGGHDDLSTNEQLTPDEITTVNEYLEQSTGVPVRSVEDTADAPPY